MVMGRKTFEQVLSFGQWAYGETPVIVLSHHGVQIPPHLQETVSGSSEAPLVLLDRLRTEGHTHLYVDGGATIHEFLAESLIDEITITRIPISIGEGIPLFDPAGKDITLTHLHTTAYEFGFVQSRYRVEKAV